MKNAILITEEYWANSQLSVARYYGGCTIGGHRFIIVNKEGKDVFECTREADLAGRKMAIEPGEPADLIRADFQEAYRKLGRERFMEALNELNRTLPNVSPETILLKMQEIIKRNKTE